MHHKMFQLTVSFFCLMASFSLYGTTLDHNVLPYKKNLKEKIFAGEIFSESKVKSSEVSVDGTKKHIQDLRFTIAGLHPKSCEYALKKLALYENYSSFLDFVKESRYDEKNGEINFLLSHTLLPYNMRLIFKLPRIDKVGVYPFSFEQGILKDLKGEIFVVNYNSRCLFFTKADWSGPHTGFPNVIFEFFSQTLAKISMERLFRLSSVL